jgi:hypothetical protein
MNCLESYKALGLGHLSGPRIASFQLKSQTKKGLMLLDPGSRGCWELVA